MMVSNDIKPSIKLGVPDKCGTCGGPIHGGNQFDDALSTGLFIFEQDNKANIRIDGQIYSFAKEKIR